MVNMLSYSTTSHVVETWEMVRKTPAFEEKAGALILQRLFQLEPRTMAVFGFTGKESIKDCPRLEIGALIHAKRMIHMLDTAVDLLVVGADVEMLTEILQKLGQKHVRYGVKASFFPFMGRAIREALKEILGEKVFRREVEDAWEEVFDELSADLMKAILNHNENDVIEDSPSFVRVL